jgi:aminopeptidase YwaD
MRKFYLRILLITFFLFLSGITFCQPAWYYQWGLLPGQVLDYFIGQSSGEHVYNSIADLSDYTRKRNAKEFSDILFESQYIVDKLNRYGLTAIETEKLGKAKSWTPVKAELWEISPLKDKIADINDLPFIISPGSPDTDTEAELVYIGDANTDDLDKLDLEGKIVLTSARPRSVINRLLQKNVIGIVSDYSPRPLEDALMIPDSKGDEYSAQNPNKLFVFNLSPRDGNILRERLLQGAEIIVHAYIKYRIEELDVQVTSCIIPGTDPDAGEIIISAHLFEGYGVQGANDNTSGSASILEVARVLKKMIDEGLIAPPRRTIRFIWVPEYSGTIPWVNTHPEIVKRTLCNINLDMVGLSLSRFKSYFVLHRTSFGNAHYLNDVLENYYRYVCETNQDNSVISGSKFFKRIVAPTGTDDPFYYQIESSSGGSDHDIFNDWGVQVPGVLMITWPDPFYHTSEDRINKCDPTQLKRVVFITAASSYTIASAGENEAINILGEVYGNAIRRIGYQIARASDEINKSGADKYNEVVKRVLGDIKGTARGEIMTLNSVSELAPSSERLRTLITNYIQSLSGLIETAVSNIISTAALHASDFGIPPLELQLTREERRAANVIPVIVKDPRETGFRGYNEKLRELSPSIRSKYPLSAISDLSEAAACIDGKNSVLDIKYLLDAQNKTETSLEGLTNYFHQLREAGFIKF